jgi:DNA-binding MarR family transcriptional regulator
VLVFGGPCSLGALAAAEQVSAPTMSRLVVELERDGWLRRSADPADARATRLAATPAARRLLERGRARRLRALSAALRTLSPADQAALAAATSSLDRLVGALAVERPPATARTSRRRFD